MSQVHPGRLDAEGELVPAIPTVDSGVVMKAGRDPVTQEFNDDPDWISYSKLHHEGSFSSGFMLRSDGYRVDLSGNIGRLDRPDNLFNLAIEETVEKASALVQQYGLPPFTPGECSVVQNPTAYDLETGQLTSWSGATVSQLHLTENYATGSAANAQAAIDWLATQSKSHVKRGRAGESTMTWGRKGARVYLKCYIKAEEMLAHAKVHGRTREQVMQDPVYIFCRDNGIIRFELEAGRLLLRDNGLRFLGDITMKKLENLFRSQVDPLLSRVRSDITRIDFDALDIKPAIKMAAMAYLRGEDVRSQLPTRTFYRYSKLLREYGIDISEPLQNAKGFATVIRVIDIAPIQEAPNWYWDYQARMATIAANSDQFAHLKEA